MYVRDTTRRKGKSPKLQPLYTGPAVVVALHGAVLYKIREKRKTQLLHYEQLNPYQISDVSLWVARHHAQEEALDNGLESTDMPGGNPSWQ